MIKQSDIFPWNSNFETGIDSIDGQHRRLVELLNRLVRAMTLKDGEMTPSPIIRSFISGRRKVFGQSILKMILDMISIGGHMLILS